MSQIKSIGELEAMGFVRQSDGSYRKQRLCAEHKEPACHPGNLGNEQDSPEATRGDLSGAGAVCGSTANGMTPKPGTRIRQSNKPLMNKLEEEFYGRIRNLYPNYPPVRPQGKTYRLANGVRLTPDFSCSTWPSETGMRETCWEVKGPRAWEDSLIKLKMAATAWPEVRWLLVWKQDGAWMEQEILP